MDQAADEPSYTADWRSVADGPIATRRFALEESTIMVRPTDDDTAQFKISMVVSEIESARDVLSCLDEVDATIHPETADVSNPNVSNVHVDLTDVTIKQWQALELAYERGYYDSPRGADLSDLASELEISKSAVSQRLRSAEATLVGAIIREIR